MFNPISTYRIQFHKDFTLSRLKKIVPYLQKLGVSTIYASPIFKASPGSTHGYDITDPNKINPEIGSIADLKKIDAKLKKNGMFWLQDIVPNHMAFHQSNAWLMDVLEKGPQSEYRHFFDQHLADAKLFQGPIMVPFLGRHLAAVLKARELKVRFNDGKLGIKYFELILPLHLRSYRRIFATGNMPNDEALERLLEQIDNALAIEDSKSYSLAVNELEMQFKLIYEKSEYRKAINDAIAQVNQQEDLLKAVLEEQEYRLCYWKDTSHTINFRRFFTVNGLICLNIQRPEVFELYHQLIRKLLKEDIFQGLRVDHVDGLYEPEAYLKQLRELAGPQTYVVVEKILEREEELVAEWPVQGTSGYEFLAQINNLFTNMSAEKAFSKFYRSLTGNHSSHEEQVRTKKKMILEGHMAGELQNLCHLLLQYQEQSNQEQGNDELGNDERVSDKQGIEARKNDEQASEDQLKIALSNFLVHCPVYRYYRSTASQAEVLIDQLASQNTELTIAYQTLKKALLNEEHFFNRCMQLSGPLMAKGVEDTLMYVNARFIAHNEVGDAVSAFGTSIEDFHQQMEVRQRDWPLALNATSTHDTKRGEDVRARLNVLSDLSEDWFQRVEEWRGLNQELKENNFPDANEEYFIYQTLIGSYPFLGEDENRYQERLLEYLQKAFREAKLHSDWAEPDEAFEGAVSNFVTGLLDKSRPFWKSFTAFHSQLADFGILNSLSQAALKFTLPGVPDLYQGCELWDLSLVDPDNRRPVDYKKMSGWLEELPGTGIDELWRDRYSGRIKLWLSHLLLEERSKESDAFLQGDYIPLKVTGKFRRHVYAFARKFKERCYIVVVPLHAAKLVSSASDLLTFDWKDTHIQLPLSIPLRYRHLLRGTYGKSEKSLAVSDVLSGAPLAVLKAETIEKERSAGILLHISSLPSRYGIGDFGPEAQAFANFLERTKQKYWQVLPLSPTTQANAHSPYSAYSSMGGNPLLISPELLTAQKLLSKSELKEHRLPFQKRIDYVQVEKNKSALFRLAWKRFLKNSELANDFDAFCEKEAGWLNDFALYSVIKAEQGNKPWYEWDDPMKHRDSKALQNVGKMQHDEIRFTQWLQYLFFTQWRQLKNYCNEHGIDIFGDLPFYISYDSVDVWAHRDLFKLDENGEPEAIAGVPPDYFNKDGQLWGMPVFDWEKLKTKQYRWWVDRIRKNLELFDLLRLDHFRAFAAYWEVPNGEETARNGKWVEGPGTDFFHKLQEELGRLPFVAEDLGEIDQPVYDLRDAFKFPGMKVLQFAFGDNVAESDYAPHNHSFNYLVYTGTHDNNTIRGWFRNDIDASVKKRLQLYTGIAPDKKNIHRLMVRMAYASVAQTAIIPMQDLLGLGQSARMNKPATLEGNWLWRLNYNQVDKALENELRNLAKIFGR